MSSGAQARGDGAGTLHAGFEELVVGYALHALEPGEEALIEAHLPGCQRCAQALVVHSEVAAGLALSLDVEAAGPVPPVLAEIFRNRPTALPPDPFPTRVTSRSVATAGRTRGPSLTSPRRRAGRPVRRMLTGAGALAVIVAVSLTAYDVHLRSTRGPSGTQAALAALADSHATVAHLTGGAASATAVVADGHAWLVSTGLAPSGAKASYVVWGLRPGARPTALAGFASAGGHNLQVVDLGTTSSATSGAYADYTVTREPQSVSAGLPDQPHGTQVLAEPGDGHGVVSG